MQISSLFRIHLSTAIVLMFVAGILIGVNITPQPYRDKTYRSLHRVHRNASGARVEPVGVAYPNESSDDIVVPTELVAWLNTPHQTSQGWPFKFLITNKDFEYADRPDIHFQFQIYEETSPLALVTNVLIATCILFVTSRMSEYLINRNRVSGHPVALRPGTERRGHNPEAQPQ